MIPFPMGVDQFLEVGVDPVIILKNIFARKDFALYKKKVRSEETLVLFLFWLS